jgi:hypothetical protein
MGKIIFAVIATLATMIFTASVYPADAEKPVVPAAPVYANVPAGGIQNDADKAAQTRKKTDAKDAKTRAKSEAKAKEAKVKADAMAAKAKAEADAAAAKDAATPSAR